MNQVLKTFNEGLRKQFKNVTSATEITASRHKSDTIETARKKVRNKAKNSKDFFADDTVVNDKGKKPDPIFKQHGDTYSLGLKSGNRWLIITDEDDGKFWTGIKKEEMPAMFDLLIAGVDAKVYDEAILATKKPKLAVKARGGDNA